MILTPNDFYHKLGYSKEFVTKVILNIDKYYLEYFEYKKKNGKIKYINGDAQKRYLNPSRWELKKIQRNLLRRIFNKVILNDCIQGCVKGKSSVVNGDMHKGNRVFFQTDLKNFFPSISTKMVYNSLRSKGFSKSVANIIISLTMINTSDSYRGTSLPQGAPTSPFLANLVFEKIDLRILELIKDKDIKYTRWVDDLTFSSKDDFSDLYIKILSEILGGGLKISRGKTTSHNGRTVITGVVASPNSIKVTQKFRNKDESKMNEMQLLGRKIYKEHVKFVDKL